MATTKVSTKLLETVGVAEGGTGAVNASAARTSLGLVIGTNVLAPNGSAASLTNLPAGGASAAEAANIMVNSFNIAAAGGFAFQNMVDGVVDEFEDETGIDTSTSTNETYDATSDFYSNGGVPSVTLTDHTDSAANATTRTFTTQSVGSGTRKLLISTAAGDAVVANTLTVDGNSATKVQEQLSGGSQRSGSLWFIDLTGSTGSSVTIVVTYASSVRSCGIGVWAVTDAAAGAPAFSGKTATTSGDTSALALTVAQPSSIVMAMADNNASATWTWDSGLNEDYDDIVDAGSGPTGHTAVSGNLSTDTTVTVTKSADGITQGCLTGAVIAGGATVDMTLVSNATTALAAPGDANIVIWQEDVDSVTLNTDLKAYASRNGGTTYTQMTLAEVANLTTGRILTGTVDISGQSSATAMKYKIETLNTKEQKIHAVALQWS